MEIENVGQLTPEQIKDLADKAALADTLAAELKASKDAQTGMTTELQDLRKKKQDAEALARAAAIDPNDIEAKMKQMLETTLAEKENKQIEISRQQYEEKFKNSRPEFNSANDPSGIKYSVFKNLLSKFDLSQLKTVEDFESVFSMAYNLIPKENGSQSSGHNPYAFTPSNKSGTQSITTDGDISSKEKNLIESLGWTKEKFLKLKQVMPVTVEKMLATVRD